jgi:hypothetical protein
LSLTLSLNIDWQKDRCVTKKQEDSDRKREDESEEEHGGK